jgi:hypothetical protein
MLMVGSLALALSGVHVGTAAAVDSVTVTVTVMDSGGNALAGVPVAYKGPYYNSFGTTNVSGVATKVLPAGTYTFKATYQNTIAEQTQDVGVDATLDFYTSKAEVQVNKSDSSAFGGVRVLFSPSSGFGNYVSVFTNVSGLASTELFPGTIWYKAITNSTSAVRGVLLPGDGTTAAQAGSVMFYTSKSIAKVESCEPSVALAGIAVKFYGGGYPGTWASAATDGSGLASIEEFPGTWKIQASVNGTSQTKDQLLAGDGTAPGQSTTTTFKPTRVTFTGSTPVQQWIGYWSSPLPSPFYMFPATIKFRLGGTGGTEVDVAIPEACTLTGALLKVRDENGGGVAGAKATPACGGAWQATLPGATNASGNLFAVLPGCTTKVKMEVNQGSVEQTSAQLTASNYTWYTEILRIYLRDHLTDPITDAAGTLDQGGGYWYAWGNLNALGYRDVQLFARAGAYKFKVTYNYTAQELYPVVLAAPGIQNFDFQTGQVIGTCITQYSTGAWRTFTSGMELMPGTYTFRYPSQPGTVTAGGITTLSCLP